MIPTIAARAGATGITDTRAMLAARVHQSIARELDAQHDLDLHTAASVAVWHRGAQLVELMHPTARRSSGPTPLFRAFSAGKPLAAAVLWRLMDAGRLDLDAPVADYWPEFAQNGKHGITVKHVLTHTAGLAPDSTRSDVDWTDWGRVVDSIAMAVPSHSPGAAMQYHAFTFGWIVAELATRVTGETFATLFQREVCQPLGLRDTYFVIRRDETDLLRRIVDLRTSRDFVDPELPQKMDGLLLLEITMPAGSCITTASDLARFYAALVDGLGTQPSMDGAASATDGVAAGAVTGAGAIIGGANGAHMCPVCARRRVAANGMATDAATDGATTTDDASAANANATTDDAATMDGASGATTDAPADGAATTDGASGATDGAAAARATGSATGAAVVMATSDATADRAATPATATATDDGAMASTGQLGGGTCLTCARAREAADRRESASRDDDEASGDISDAGVSNENEQHRPMSENGGAPVATSTAAPPHVCDHCARRRETLGVAVPDNAATTDGTPDDGAARAGMTGAGSDGAARARTTGAGSDGTLAHAEATASAVAPSTAASDGVAGAEGIAATDGHSAWLSPETRRRIFESHADLFDLDVRRFVKFGLGVGLADHQPNRMAAPDGSGSFGHGGLGTCVAWADPAHELAAAILTDTAHPESVNYRRLNRISAAIRDGLALESGDVAEL